VCSVVAWAVSMQLRIALTPALSRRTGEGELCAALESVEACSQSSASASI